MSSPTILALKIDEIWSDILLITELELQAMSTKPLKWLRHVGWCLYGTLGALHTMVDGKLEPIPDDELVSGFASQYYYVSESDAEPRYLDPDLLKDYSETGATVRKKFRVSLLQRDGSCIFREASLNQEVRLNMSLDGADDHVRGVHFIPHCKGDEYLKRLQHIRGVPRTMWLDGLDDPRNGALMWSDIHCSLSNATLTMLLVPNQYMSVDDAPPGPSERLDWPPPGDDTEFRVPSPPTDTETVLDMSTVTNDESSVYPPPGRTTPGPEEGRYNFRASMQDIKEHEDLAKEEKEETDAEQEAHRFEAEGKDSGYVPFTSQSKVILQHLQPQDAFMEMCAPNNTRAALRRWTRLSPVALHATYGFAILNRFSVTRTARKVKAGATDGEEELGRKRKRKRKRKKDNDDDEDKGLTQKKAWVTRSAGTDPAPAGMDAWDFLLSLHMPPEHVIAEHRAKQRKSVTAWADNVEPHEAPG